MINKARKKTALSVHQVVQTVQILIPAPYATKKKTGSQIPIQANAYAKKGINSINNTEIAKNAFSIKTSVLIYALNIAKKAKIKIIILVKRKNI